MDLNLPESNRENQAPVDQEIQNFFDETKTRVLIQELVEPIIKIAKENIYVCNKQNGEVKEMQKKVDEVYISVQRMFKEVEQIQAVGHRISDCQQKIDILKKKNKLRFGDFQDKIKEHEVKMYDMNKEIGRVDKKLELRDFKISKNFDAFLQYKDKINADNQQFKDAMQNQIDIYMEPFKQSNSVFKQSENFYQSSKQMLDKFSSQFSVFELELKNQNEKFSEFIDTKFVQTEKNIEKLDQYIGKIHLAQGEIHTQLSISSNKLEPISNKIQHIEEYIIRTLPIATHLQISESLQEFLSPLDKYKLIQYDNQKLQEFLEFRDQEISNEVKLKGIIKMINQRISTLFKFMNQSKKGCIKFNYSKDVDLSISEEQLLYVDKGYEIHLETRQNQLEKNIEIMNSHRSTSNIGASMRQSTEQDHPHQKDYSHMTAQQVSNFITNHYFVIKSQNKLRKRDDYKQKKKFTNDIRKKMEELALNQKKMLDEFNQQIKQTDKMGSVDSIESGYNIPKFPINEEINEDQSDASFDGIINKSHKNESQTKSIHNQPHGQELTSNKESDQITNTLNDSRRQTLDFTSHSPFQLQKHLSGVGAQIAGRESVVSKDNLTHQSNRRFTIEEPALGNHQRIPSHSQFNGMDDRASGINRKNTLQGDGFSNFDESAARELDDKIQQIINVSQKKSKFFSSKIGLLIRQQNDISLSNYQSVLGIFDKVKVAKESFQENVDFLDVKYQERFKQYEEQMAKHHADNEEFKSQVMIEYVDFFKHRARVKAEINNINIETNLKIEKCFQSQKKQEKLLDFIASMMPSIVETLQIIQNIQAQDIQIREILSQSLRLSELPNEGYLFTESKRPGTTTNIQRQEKINSSTERLNGTQNKFAFSPIKNIIANPDKPIQDAFQGSLYLKNLTYRDHFIDINRMCYIQESLLSQLDSTINKNSYFKEKALIPKKVFDDLFLNQQPYSSNITVKRINHIQQNSDRYATAQNQTKFDFPSISSIDDNKKSRNFTRGTLTFSHTDASYSTRRQIEKKSQKLLILDEKQTDLKMQDVLNRTFDDLKKNQWKNSNSNLDSSYTSLEPSITPLRPRVQKIIFQDLNKDSSHSRTSSNQRNGHHSNKKKPTLTKKGLLNQTMIQLQRPQTQGNVSSIPIKVMRNKIRQKE